MPEIIIRQDRSISAIHEARRLHSLVMPADDAELCIHRDSLVWFAKPKGDSDIYAAFATMRVTEHWAFLNSAGVLPGWRGLGLHRRLIRARVREAVKRGVTPITYTAIGNHRSANNLIACGFESYTPQEPWVGENVNYWRFV